MKFEEVLPALRDGKKIKRKPWKSDQYICLENGDNLPLYYVLEDDWEIVEGSESTYDWGYIIKNKCLCWFWDKENIDKSFNYLNEVNYAREVAPYKDEFGYAWKNCRPVRKDELNFYEDRKDN